MNLKDQIVENKDIYLTDDEVNILGPGLSVVDCDIQSTATSKYLSIFESKFEGGSFTAIEPLVNFQWCKIKLSGVRFDGVFSGCDFGHWPEFHGELGGVEECDFGGAVLSNCRFMNCDIDTLVLPGWPCFSIVNPSAISHRIKSINWPGKLGLIMGIFANSPEACTAITANAVELVGRLGGSEESFRAALEELGGVIT
jgi:hypothetical protein